MPIDPVVLLAEKIRSATAALRETAKTYQLDGQKEVRDSFKQHLLTIKDLYSELSKTMPTSALGAGELVRLVVQHLPPSFGRYASDLYQIAGRLGEGQRIQRDLVWLRAMRTALASAPQGLGDDRAILLLNLAIVGAARPVVIFRSVLPMRMCVTDAREVS